MRSAPMRIVASFVAGALVGVLCHYALYRIGLPLKAFIYVAF